MKFEYYIIGGMLFLVLGVLALVAVSPSDIPWPKPASKPITIPTESESLVHDVKTESMPVPEQESQEVSESVAVELEEKVSLSEMPIKEQAMIEEPAIVEETVVSPVVSISDGSGVPGCEETNECFVPYELKVSVGTEVTWDNQDVAAHTVTSGTASGGPDGIFDSSIFMSGSSFSHKFDAAGEYNYFCMVHPWMKGIVIVE